MAPVTKCYKVDEVLFNEGDPSRSIFIVRKGAVSIRKSLVGKSAEVGLVRANEVIGELSFFDRKPRSATAIVLVEIEVLEISFEAMDKVYSHMPEYMKTIIAAMADRLREANEQIKVLNSKTNKR